MDNSLHNCEVTFTSVISLLSYFHNKRFKVNGCIFIAFYTADLVKRKNAILSDASLTDKDAAMKNLRLGDSGVSLEDLRYDDVTVSLF